MTGAAVLDSSGSILSTSSKNKTNNLKKQLGDVKSYIEEINKTKYFEVSNRKGASRIRITAKSNKICFPISDENYVCVLSDNGWKENNLQKLKELVSANSEVDFTDLKYISPKKEKPLSFTTKCYYPMEHSLVNPSVVIRQVLHGFRLILQSLVKFKVPYYRCSNCGVHVHEKDYNCYCCRYPFKLEQFN